MKPKMVSAGRCLKIIDLFFVSEAFLVKFKRIMLDLLHKLTLISLDFLII